MSHELLVPDALLSEEPGTHLNSREAPTRHADLSELPRRASAAFQVRHTKRMEVIVRLQAKLEEAIAAGIEVPSMTLDSRLGEIAAADTKSPADADFTKLLQLNLGKPGELGEPIRWNDPRLGPLWPNGPPAWHVEAEKQLRELENKIADLPAPGQAPPPVSTRQPALTWLHEQYNQGKLDKYPGQYVFAGDQTLLGHGKNLGKVREAAEKKATKKGIPLEHLAFFYVMTA